MNLPPRQQQILELVRERGYVSIEEMAGELSRYLEGMDRLFRKMRNVQGAGEP